MAEQSRHHGFGRRAGLQALAGAALGAAGLAAWRAVTPTEAIAAADDASWCGFRCGHLTAEWSLTAFRAIQAEQQYRDPLGASRLLAMMHLAMHDAVNAAAPRFATYALEARDTGADPAVAAAVAAHEVLRAALPGQEAALEAELGRTLAESGASAPMARGRALGVAAARAVLADRATDGATDQLAYAPADRPGAYRYTPGFDSLFAPHWRKLRPFALRSPDQFRVPGPPALESAAYAAAFDEVKSLGSKDSAARSPEQTRIAHFWYEFSDIGWNRIARVVARERGLDLWQGARFFALVNMALADSYVAGWDSKLHYDAWRPVTAIRAAATDGNTATLPDAAWEPLLPTPPIQDHPSTHSALGAAAAEVMAILLGDAMPFAFASSSALPAQPVRRFSSFSAAAEENAESRVLAGLHFRFACDAGLALGRQIGRFAVAQHLKPLE